MTPKVNTVSYKLLTTSYSHLLKAEEKKNTTTSPLLRQASVQEGLGLRAHGAAAGEEGDLGSVFRVSGHGTFFGLRFRSGSSGIKVFRGSSSILEV